MSLSDIPHFAISQKVKLKPLEADGFILDLGGGGEGVIGKLMGERVVAIDKRKDELLEAENSSLKVVMDAADLKFLDESFGTVTSFFTMMYIPPDLRERVFEEAYRVLKNGGYFYLWDVTIPDNSKDYRFFVIYLEYALPSGVYKTGYGVPWRSQGLDHFKTLATRAGFSVAHEERDQEIIHLVLRK